MQTKESNWCSWAHQHPFTRFTHITLMPIVNVLKVVHALLTIDIVECKEVCGAAISTFRRPSPEGGKGYRLPVAGW